MKYILYLIIMTPVFTYAQVNLNVIKYSTDSFDIFLDDGVELKMHEPYDFIVKTNINPSDNIVLSVKQDTVIYDGLTFSKTFVHHEYGFFVKRENRLIGDQKVIKIKGTKFDIKIDGKTITRYQGNRVKPNSVIDIELKSDLCEVNSLKVNKSIIMFWSKEHDSYRQFSLEGNKLKIDLSKEKKFRKKFNPDEDLNFLVLYFPQVYDNDNQGVLASEQKERTFLLTYEISTGHNNGEHP